MEIQTNTDSTIKGDEPLTIHVEDVVKTVLGHFSHQITRVVVHLSESKDSKYPNSDHRCMMEARIQGHSPVVADDHAASLHQAIHNSAEKLKRAIDSTLGRLQAASRKGERIGDKLVDVTDNDETDQPA